MKLRTAFAMAITLAAATITQSSANAGIIFTIRFGGFHRHHVVHRHHATRVARHKSSDTRKTVKTVRSTGPSGPMTMKTPEGDVMIQGTNGKGLVEPVVVRRPGATTETARQIPYLYDSFPEVFRDAAGPVTFFLSGTNRRGRLPMPVYPPSYYDERRISRGDLPVHRRQA